MIKNTFYENQAQTIIKKLQGRKMEGYYCPTREAALEKLLELIGPEHKIVARGGSVTLNEIGAPEAVRAAGHELVFREDYADQKAWKLRQAEADVYITSTNAITLEGELVNIDGRGNRVAMMIFGPDSVIVVAGMNKVVTDVPSGFLRVRNMAAPPNTLRLGLDTPCAKTGVCGNCISKSICCNFVVTRASSVPGRIKVILVGEELGY